MILVGNQRGNAKNLALHLLKEENERVAVHELRGFASDNLVEALNESYAKSRATKCKQHLFSLSLNPPQEAQVSNEDFEKAIGEAEKRLGLTGQPRAIVFHEKEGRRHCHAVWSRINIQEMKAVQLSYHKNKLQSLARDLYLEHGWKMPKGLAKSEERNPLNYSLAEWQQAKRVGKDAKDIKADFQDAWAISDSKAAFTHALEERGYKLARGDRRGFVAVDHHGEFYSISKWTDIKPKQVAARLGDPNALPSATEVKAKYAQAMLTKMQNFQKQNETETKAAQQKAKAERQKLEQAQHQKASFLQKQQALRTKQEELRRQARLRKGWKGILDRVTGKHKKTLELNAIESQKSKQRDNQEQTTLLTRHTEQKQRLTERQTARDQRYKEERQELQQDAKTYEQMKNAPTPDKKKEYMKKRQCTSQPKHQDINKNFYKR